MAGRGFHWFVAMRYLRGAAYKPPRATVVAEQGAAAPSRLALLATDLVDGLRFSGSFLARTIRRGSLPLRLLTAAGIVVALAAIAIRYLVLEEPDPGSYRAVDPWVQRTELVAIVAGALAVIFGTLALLRAGFSFFSTVSVAGVWIGTMALVFVLSVMSGFENDLRGKILGSNAHIQISREDGDFVEWEEVMGRVQKVPGVIASTPFAVSEVLIAANNNYFNVIIKGIDPDQIGNVTDLPEDLMCNDRTCSRDEAKQVMARLFPLEPDELTREVPQAPSDTGGSGSGVDEAPSDMVDGTDPIDYSADDEDDPDGDEDGDEDDDGNGEGAGSGSGTGGSGSGNGNGSGTGTGTGTGSGSVVGGGSGPVARPSDLIDTEPPAPFGGDAPRVLGLDAEPGTYDDLDADLDLDDDRRITRVNPDGSVSHTISISPVDIAPMSKRVRMLPGVLVGKELTKQIHLYPDQEVRLVSPLSDPANPDATGTPIPFNRDYRIAGTFYTGMYEYDLKFVYVTLDSLQDFLDRGDAVDGLEVRIADADETPTVVAALQRALGPAYRVQDWRELNRSLFSALKLEKIAMFLVLAIIILVASFSIVGNLVMVVVEKGKEIALLKTLGASDRGVTWIFMTQGFFIGLFGTLLGVAYGLVGCVLAKAYGIPINPDVYYIDELPIHVDLPSVGLIAAAGLVISVGATLYPAIMASRLRPSVGLRH